MCSYAVVNSAPSCANADMLQNGLDEQANYGGFVVSDWGAAGNAVADAEGGMDIAMPFSDASNVTAALTAGTLNQATLNAVVARILTQMFAFGLFDNPADGSLSATVTSAAHQQTALQLGEEGTVLLKNNGILPLNPNPPPESIAVIGTDGGAAVELAGGGSGGVDSSNTVWPLTGIQNAVGPNVKVTYTAGDDNGTTDIPQAVAAAQAATDAIVYVSPPEGEESDLTTLDLSSADETMIARRGRGQPAHHRGDQQRLAGGHAVAELGGRGVRELVRRRRDRRGDGRADLRHRRPVGQAAGHLPGQPQPGPGADHRAVAGHRRPAPIYSEGVDIGYRWYQSQNITPRSRSGTGCPTRSSPSPTSTSARSTPTATRP